MAGSIRVVGGYDRKAHPEVVRKMITRGQSPVGNPAVMATEADRDKVCRHFDDLVLTSYSKKAQNSCQNRLGPSTSDTSSDK